MDVSRVNKKLGFLDSWVELIVVLLVFGALFVFVEMAQPLSILESCDFVRSFDLGYLQPSSIIMQVSLVEGEPDAI